MPKDEKEPNPIDDYVDMMNHRYTPGYYTGGRLSPLLRKARLSPRDRRQLGVVFLLTSAVATGALVVEYSKTGSFVLIIPGVVVALLGVAGVAMYRSGRSSGPS